MVHQIKVFCHLTTEGQVYMGKKVEVLGTHNCSLRAEGGKIGGDHYSRRCGTMLQIDT